MQISKSKLIEYLDSNLAKYEYLQFDSSCHSIEDASRATGESADSFVKNVCFVDSNNNLIVAIVAGDKRASSKRVAVALKIDRPTLATPEIILQKSGFVIGGVPSFGYEAIFLVDDEVVNKEYVITGGGDEKSLIKIDTKTLLKLNRAKVCRVRK